MKAVPQEVLNTLTLDELREFQTVADQKKEPYDFMRLENLTSENKAIHYLLMNDPLKYSLLTDARIEEDELMALLAYDAAGLDSYHGVLWEGREAEGLWSQRFDSVMAALGNPNLSCENAKILLDELMAQAHEPISSEEFLNVVTYQLEDKWELRDFNSSVLSALVNLLEQEGMTEHLPRYKRLQRKALKRESL